MRVEIKNWLLEHGFHEDQATGSWCMFFEKRPCAVLRLDLELIDSHDSAVEQLRHSFDCWKQGGSRKTGGLSDVSIFEAAREQAVLYGDPFGTPTPFYGKPKWLDELEKSS